ncbi:MAG TPA: hypothetical protein DCE41_02590 [Cytophagales bacterium]|nr:hypothetical protein [Cytophagales bacterium]
MGSGLSYYHINDVYAQSISRINGEITDIDFAADNRQSFGANVILEYTLSLGDRLLVGAKVYTQPYFNGDINSGAMLKTGIRL